MQSKVPYQYDYPMPCVTVDMVVLRPKDENFEVLLIKRGRDPFKGMWALPGGHVDENEDLPVAARRELLEETGLEVEKVVQIGAFGKPGRDPRGWYVSVAYAAYTEGDGGSIHPGDDAAEAEWFHVDHLPPLAFDHKDIINRAFDSDAPGW